MGGELRSPEDVEADAIESELAAERTATSTVVKCFERNRPARKPFPECQAPSWKGLIDFLVLDRPQTKRSTIR